MRTLILVSCCGPKLQHPAPARELYTSQLFRLARTYAEQSGHDWVILSALHGVVQPDAVIEPYDQRLPARQADRQAWGYQVTAALQQLAQGEPTRYLSLCGADYTDPLRVVHVETPMQGLGIGQRLAWLTERTSGQSLELFA